MRTCLTLYMRGEIQSINQNIVNVGDKMTKHVLKDIINEALKNRRGVAPTKRHNLVFIVSPSGQKVSFPCVSDRDPHLSFLQRKILQLQRASSIYSSIVASST